MTAQCGFRKTLKYENIFLGIVGVGAERASGLGVYTQLSSFRWFCGVGGGWDLLRLHLNPYAEAYSAGSVLSSPPVRRI